MLSGSSVKHVWNKHDTAGLETTYSSVTLGIDVVFQGCAMVDVSLQWFVTWGVLAWSSTWIHLIFCRSSSNHGALMCIGWFLPKSIWRWNHLQVLTTSRLHSESLGCKLESKIPLIHRDFSSQKRTKKLGLDRQLLAYPNPKCRPLDSCTEGSF